MAGEVPHFLSPEHPKQHSEEWEAVRLQSINASEVPYIVSARKPVSFLQLRSKKPFTNAYIEFGREIEPEVKQKLEERYGWNIIEVGSVPHKEYKWLRASPDGCIKGKEGEYILIEIKSVKNMGNVMRNRKKYDIQIQTQLEVCDVDEALLIMYDYQRNAMYNRVVRRNREFFEKTIFPKIKACWESGLK